MEPLVLSAQIKDNILLKIQLFGLRFLGYVIFDDQYLPKLHNFRGYFFTFSFVLFNLTQYIDLIFVWGNLAMMTVNASTTLLYTTTVARMFDFYINRDKIIKIIKQVHDGLVEIRKSENQKEIEILDKYCRYMKWVTILFGSPSVITTLGMCLNALVNGVLGLLNGASDDEGPPPLVMRFWLPIPLIWDNFFIYYAIQVYTVCISVTMIPCWHTFIVGLMVYSILNLKILKLNLQQFESSKNSEKSPKEINADARKTLCKLIEKQLEIREYVSLVHSLMSRSVFIDFVLFSALICALLYEIITTSSPVVVFINICYILTMCMVLYLYHWHANEIGVHSETIGLAIYTSHWYEFDVKFQKMVLQLICCSSKPIKLKAGFITMSMETFLSVLRASYSYFSILRRTKI